jgi:hypothetical protein
MISSTVVFSSVLEHNLLCGQCLDHILDPQCRQQALMIHHPSHQQHPLDRMEYTMVLEWEIRLDH